MSENKLGNALKQNVTVHFRLLHYFKETDTQRKKCVGRKRCVKAFCMSCDRNILCPINIQRLTLGFRTEKYVVLNAGVHRFFNSLGGASKFYML